MKSAVPGDNNETHGPGDHTHATRRSTQRSIAPANSVAEQRPTIVAQTPGAASMLIGSARPSAGYWASLRQPAGEIGAHGLNHKVDVESPLSRRPHTDRPPQGRASIISAAGTDHQPLAMNADRTRVRPPPLEPPRRSSTANRPATCGCTTTIRVAFTAATLRGRRTFRRSQAMECRRALSSARTAHPGESHAGCVSAPWPAARAGRRLVRSRAMARCDHRFERYERSLAAEHRQESAPTGRHDRRNGGCDDNAVRRRAGLGDLAHATAVDPHAGDGHEIHDGAAEPEQAKWRTQQIAMILRAPDQMRRGRRRSWPDLRSAV